MAYKGVPKGVSPPKQVPNTSGQGVSRRSYEYGYSKGMSGGGMPQSDSGTGLHKLKTPPVAQSRNSGSSSMKSFKKDAAEQIKWNVNFGDTGLTSGDEVV